MSDEIPTIKPVAVVEPKVSGLLPWILVSIGTVGLILAFFAAGSDFISLCKRFMKLIIKS